MAPSGDDSVSQSHSSEGPCVHRPQSFGCRPSLERLSLEVVDVTHGESPYWYYGGSSCVFSSIRPANSFSWARIAPEKPFPILCNLPLIAHQLASARVFFGAASAPTSRTGAPAPPASCGGANRPTTASRIAPSRG